MRITNILPILSLLSNIQGVYLHVLKYSLISLIRVLQFLAFVTCTLFLFNLYLVHFLNNDKWYFLISNSNCSLLKMTSFWILTVQSTDLLNSFMYSATLITSLGFSRQKILLSANIDHLISTHLIHVFCLLFLSYWIS